MASQTPERRPKFPDLKRMLKEEDERSRSRNNAGTKPIRIWVDGCFDLVHFGHSNALRQAKAMGDTLVVGVHNDEEIIKHKGPPVLNMEERIILVKAVKWVDEVVEDVPYVTGLEQIEKHNCDYCAHGEDITIGTDGSFSYQKVYDAGKFRVFHRTIGVSTTDLVGRMLLLTKDHFIKESLEPKSPMKKFAAEATIISPFTGVYTIDPYKEQILQCFSEGMEKKPKLGEKVVYVAGAFDLFHAGHVLFLKACLEYGSYIILGIHDDQVVNSYKGGNYPIMNLEERVLGSLACKYVSDVVIGAPYCVSDDLLDFFKVDFVIHGKTPYRPCTDGTDPYEAPKRRGLFRQVDSGSKLTATEIVMRIINNRLGFEERNKAKQETHSKIESS